MFSEDAQLAEEVMLRGGVQLGGASPVMLCNSNAIFGRSEVMMQLCMPQGPHPVGPIAPDGIFAQARAFLSPTVSASVHEGDLGLSISPL